MSKLTDEEERQYIQLLLNSPTKSFANRIASLMQMHNQGVVASLITIDETPDTEVGHVLQRSIMPIERDGALCYYRWALSTGVGWKKFEHDSQFIVRDALANGEQGNTSSLRSASYATFKWFGDKKNYIFASVLSEQTFAKLNKLLHDNALGSKLTINGVRELLQCI